MRNTKIYALLTSISKNESKLYERLECILNQSLLPDKCYLILSEDLFYNNIEFKDRIIPNILSNELFEIIWYKDIDKYCKIIPNLNNKLNEDYFIITLDNDSIYTKNLVQDLVQDFNNKKVNFISYKVNSVNNNIPWGTYIYNNTSNRCNLQLNFYSGKNSILYYSRESPSTENLFIELCPTKDNILFDLLKECDNINIDIKKINNMTTRNENVLFINYSVNNTGINSIDINTIISKINNNLLTNNDVIMIVKNKNLFIQYTDIFNCVLNYWSKYIENNLIPLMGDRPEGNIYSSHKEIKPSKSKEGKQKNIFNLFNNKIQNSNKVLEIGFNGGFSALLMLLSNPEIDLTCVDINLHNYVIPCFNRINSDFSSLKLITERSQIALQKLIDDGEKYDTIHIDGDHSLKGAVEDMNLCLKLSHKSTIIIFDDTNIRHLDNLCNIYIRDRKVKEFIFPDKINNSKCNHRFLEVL